MSARRWVGAALLGVTALGCGDRDRAPAELPGVAIVAPADGDTVSVPFTVQFAARGVAVVPADGLRTDGQGHHHLLIDQEVPEGMPIPAGPGFLHIGTGATELRIDSLPPGLYRLIAVLGHGDHVPLPSVATDTVRITVR